MALEKLGLEIVVEGLKKFKGDMKSADDAVGSSASRWGKLGGVAQGAGKILGTVAKVGLAAVATGAIAVTAAIGGLTFGLSKMIKEGTLSAARLEELTIVAHLLGKRAGYSAKEVDDLVDSVKEMGIRSDVAAGLVAQFSRYELDMADSANLARVAQDAAVISMQDSSEALDGLLHGILTYNPRVLRTYGITVQAKDAFAAMAEQLGINVDELTNSQRSQAMLNAVLKEGSKIAGAYEAAMETPGKQVRSFSRYVYELRTAMGQPFLDAFGGAVNVSKGFVKELSAAAEEGGWLNIAMTTLGEELGNLIANIGPRLMEWLKNASIWMGENLPAAIESFRAGIAAAGQFITETAIPAFQTIVSWIKENGEPILAGLAAILLIVVVPAFIAWAAAAISAAVATIAALAPILIPILAIGAVVALLAQAWKKDWGGIQTKARIVADALKEYWEEVMYPALLKVWEFIKDNVVPIWEKLVLFFQEDVAKALKELRRLWEEVVYPALVMVWEFIQDNVIPIFEVLIDIIEILLVNAIETFLQWWEEKLLPALKTVWKFIEEKVIPILKTMWSWIKEKLGVAMEWLAEKVIPPLIKAFEWLKGILEGVYEFLLMVYNLLKKIKVPDDIARHSPSAFERSFQAAADVLKQLSEVEIPKLIVGFGALSTAASPVMGAVSGGSSDTYTTYNYNLATSTTATAGSVAEDFADMAMATR